jgi:nuclear pore complex protein Nup54
LKTHCLGTGGAFSFTGSGPTSNLVRPNTAFGTQTAANPFGGFGQQQSLFSAPSSQQQQPSESELIDYSVYACSIFGDDRDDILRRWNMLQACWGVGKAVYNASAPPVNLTPDNRYCKFKAIGYSSLPKPDKVHNFFA